MKKLLNALFVLEDKEKDNEAVTPTNQVANDPFKAYSQQNSHVTSPSQENSVSVNSLQAGSSAMSDSQMEAFRAHMDEIFKGANLPGPDYNEFSTMLNAMQGVSDEIKFPACYSGLAVQGLDRTKLVESANHYIAIIQKDEKEFKDTVNSELNLRKSTVTHSEKTISDLQAKIQEINNQIEKEKENINRNLESLSSIQNKIGLYEKACQQKINEIQSNLTKINQFIK